MEWLENIKSKTSKDLEKINDRLAELEKERKELLKMRTIYQTLSGKKAENEAKGSIADIVLAILEKAGKPLALKEIYQRMLDQGHEFRGEEPKMSIYAALARNKAPNGKFVNLKSKQWTITSLLKKSDAKHIST